MPSMPDHVSQVQEETQEYASEEKLRELVKRYSEFINFPIYLYDSKEVDVPVEEEEEDLTSSPVSDEIEDEGQSSRLPIARDQCLHPLMNPMLCSPKTHCHASATSLLQLIYEMGCGPDNVCMSLGVAAWRAPIRRINDCLTFYMACR